MRSRVIVAGSAVTQYTRHVVEQFSEINGIKIKLYPHFLRSYRPSLKTCVSTPRWPPRCHGSVFQTRLWGVVWNTRIWRIGSWFLQIPLLPYSNILFKCFPVRPFTLVHFLNALKEALTFRSLAVFIQFHVHKFEFGVLLTVAKTYVLRFQT